MGPADPPVLGDADAAAVAAQMGKLVDRLGDRDFRIQIVDPRHHLRRQSETGDAFAVAEIVSGMDRPHAWLGKQEQEEEEEAHV